MDLKQGQGKKQVPVGNFHPPAKQTAKQRTSDRIQQKAASKIKSQIGRSQQKLRKNQEKSKAHQQQLEDFDEIEPADPVLPKTEMEQRALNSPPNKQSSVKIEPNGEQAYTVQSPQAFNCPPNQYPAGSQESYKPLEQQPEKRFKIKRLDFDLLQCTEQELEEQQQQLLKSATKEGTADRPSETSNLQKPKLMKTMIIYKIDEGAQGQPDPRKYIELKYTDQKFPPMFSEDNLEQQKKIQAGYKQKIRTYTLSEINSVKLGPNNKLFNLLDEDIAIECSQDGSYFPFSKNVVETEVNMFPSIVKKKIMCNCKKTKCLKLYCDCFSSGIICSENCKCSNCANSNLNSEEVKNARAVLIDRNPCLAPKFQQDQVQQELEDKIIQKGCNCKRSNCLKKYCECYNLGLKCCESCNCEDCKNRDAQYLLKSNQKENKELKLNNYNNYFKFMENNPNNFNNNVDFYNNSTANNNNNNTYANANNNNNMNQNLSGRNKYCDDPLKEFGIFKGDNLDSQNFNFSQKINQEDNELGYTMMQQSKLFKFGEYSQNQVDQLNKDEFIQQQKEPSKLFESKFLQQDENSRLSNKSMYNITNQVGHIKLQKNQQLLIEEK